MKVMNKDVHHDGKHYKKGEAVEEGDKGFKTLLADGHLNEGRANVAKAEKADDDADEKPAAKPRK